MPPRHVPVMGDILKALCAGLAAVLAGVVLLLQPGEVGKEIAAEIPYAERFGLGALGFGGLTLLTALLQGMAPDARLTHMCRCLMMSIGMGVLAALLVWGGAPRFHSAWVLSQEGEVATAQVVGKTASMTRGSPKLRLQIAYGPAYQHRGTVTVPGMPTDRRSSIRVVYAPSQPEIVQPAPDDTGFLALLDQSTTLWGAGLGLFFLLLFGGMSIGYFLAFWSRPRVDGPNAG